MAAGVTVAHLGRNRLDIAFDDTVHFTTVAHGTRKILILSVR